MNTAAGSQVVHGAPASAGLLEDVKGAKSPAPLGPVLHVLEATIGGTKRHLLDLAAGLRQQGWEIEVACPRVRDEAIGDLSFWGDLRAAGIPTHEVPMRRRTLCRENMQAIARLAWLIRRRRYAIVHAHSSVAGAVARPAAILAGASSGRRPKVVYTPHGFAFLTPGSPLRRRALLAIERALGRWTDCVIAVSPAEAKETVAYRVVPPARVATIPNGIATASGGSEAAADRAVVREREGWSHRPVVGTLARMTPQKDPFTWLQAAARIAAAHPEVQFVWIWGGELEPQVRACAGRLGLMPRLRFLGYREDARQLLAGFDVFLLSSAFEGLPYSAIEALAAGTPVVATDVTGTRDVVRHGETGLLAPPGDPEALARHVLALLDDPDLARRLAQAGQRDVLARFSVQRMVEQTAALYQTLLG